MQMFGFLPAGHRLRHFSPSRLYVDRSHGFVVVLNPKVASTFLRDFLTRGVKAHYGWDDPSQGRFGPLSMARRFPVAPVGDYVDALRNPDRYAAFAFTRNPYLRLKSAWKDKFHNGHLHGYSRSTRTRTLAPLRAFARKAGLEGAADGTPVPFSTFVAHVVASRPGTLDHHWDRQHLVLMDGQFPRVRYFKVESEFADGLVEIFHGHGGFARDWVLANNQRRNASRSDDLAVYDEDLARQVHAAHERDFALFGYDRESWRGH